MIGTEAFRSPSTVISIWCGCAGGADSTLVLPLERKKAASKNLIKLHVHGLRGGHSGIDINQGRGNAIKLLARALDQAQATAKFEVVSIEGRTEDE